MKRVVFWLIVVSLLAAADLPVAYDPFHSAQKIIKAHKSAPVFYPVARPLRLYAIMNKKAFINNKFYGIGAIIEGFKIVAILDDRVVLQRGKEKKILFLAKKKVLQVTSR